MTDQSSANSFDFNPLIHAEILDSLYENDYQYIEEIFNTALTHLDADVEMVRSAADPETLRKAVHKIKPTFGFLGMPDIEQQCKQFEERCKTSQSIEPLAADLDSLLQAIQKAKTVIEQDYQKLIIYNKAQA